MWNSSIFDYVIEFLRYGSCPIIVQELSTFLHVTHNVMSFGLSSLRVSFLRHEVKWVKFERHLLIAIMNTLRVIRPNMNGYNHWQAVTRKQYKRNFEKRIVPIRGTVGIGTVQILLKNGSTQSLVNKSRHISDGRIQTGDFTPLFATFHGTRDRMRGKLCN